MQKTIIDRLDYKDILELKKIAVSKYRDKKRLPKIYSLWDLSPTVGICWNIFEKEKANVTNNDAAITSFKHRLMTDDISILDKIVGLTERSE
jgi:hypothetical protein